MEISEHSKRTVGGNAKKLFCSNLIQVFNQIVMKKPGDLERFKRMVSDCLG